MGKYKLYAKTSEKAHIPTHSAQQRYKIINMSKIIINNFKKHMAHKRLDSKGATSRSYQSPETSQA